MIAINETRLDQAISNSTIKLSNYEVFRKDRNRNGGGVCIFLHNKNNFRVRTDLESNEIEAICIEILKPNSKPFAVIAAYRPPGQDPDLFFTRLSRMIEVLDYEGKEIYILGDLNCNVLDESNNRAKLALQSLSEIHQLDQLITEPTRVTENSKSLIDVILTNNVKRVTASGVIHLGISDHSLIFAIRKVAIPSKTTHTTVKIRNLKRFDPYKFRDDLRRLPWHKLSDINDPNIRWEMWKNMFLSSVDKHAPFKTKRIKNKKSPWLTAELKHSLIERDSLKRMAIKSGDQSDWQRFKNAKNKCNNQIRKTKKDFYYQHISENSGNSKEIWKVINEIGSRNTKSDNNILSLKIGEQTITDPEEVSLCMNNHFAEIGPKLAACQERATKLFTDYIKPVDSSFSLTPISATTVFKLLASMSENKATGLDGIPCKLLKEAASVIAVPLCDIFNLSIQISIFPSDWKLAKVIPVYKSGVKEDVNNYRPISLISAVAKVFERIVYDQLYEYVSKNNLLSNAQSGFRPSHSSATALLDATIEWFNNMDQGRLNSVVYLDLAKAFDTVDHDILIHKLSLYGVCDSSLNWFKSYITNRVQRCIVNGHLSEQRSLKCGVPQGSILGPLLFLIYINDLPCCLEHSNARLYADDTNITTTGSSIVEITNSAEADLQNIKEWLIANKLSLNVTKTEQMFIGSDHNLSKIREDTPILLDKKPIKRVKASKSLGIYIDERLSWHDQINEMSKKITKAIGGLRQVRQFVPVQTAIIMYKSLIQPLFDYCDIVWDNMPLTTGERLQKLQNRAARVITCQSYEVRSNDILQQLGWKTLAERRYIHKAKMMFKIFHGNAPSYLMECFTKSTVNNAYDLRNRDNCLVLPKPRTEYLKKSFQYAGAKLWNNLPPDIRSQNNFSTFKREIIDNYL